MLPVCPNMYATKCFASGGDCHHQWIPPSCSFYVTTSVPVCKRACMEAFTSFVLKQKTATWDQKPSSLSLCPDPLLRMLLV